MKVLFTQCFLLFLSAHALRPRKPSWRDHPVYKAHSGSITPPILALHTTRVEKEYPHEVSSHGFYVRQGFKGRLLSDKYAGKPAAKSLVGYDLLVLPGTQGTPIQRFVTIETTRRSQMCIVLSVADKGNLRGKNGVMRVGGFKSLGRASWTPFSQTPKAGFVTANPSAAVDYSYIACKDINAGEHTFPSVELLNMQYKARKYDLIFSEVGGKIPDLTKEPPGWSGGPIRQRRRCPQALHDMWVVGSHDPTDPDIAGKSWQTWHPQRDYLYGCYYGHEHGTPGMLAGYEERFHYTAWKNKRQSESHTGFKSYVLPHGRHFVVLNIHADMRNLERINRQHHTMVIAVTDRSSGKALYEMSCKANFGGSFASSKKPLMSMNNRAMLPVGNQFNKRLVLSTMFNVSNIPFPKPSRRVNVFNVGNLDPRLIYKRSPGGKILGRGLYEVWVGGVDKGAYCMTADEHINGIELDIKDPDTACKRADCTERVRLGRFPTNGWPFFPSVGRDRALKFRGIKIRPSNCPFALPAPGGDGYMKFYTDPYCHSLCSGPGKNCVMQRIHSSFTGIDIRNVFEVSDVHGHNTYTSVSRYLQNGDESPKKMGYIGIAQIEGALQY